MKSVRQWDKQSVWTMRLRLVSSSSVFHLFLSGLIIVLVFLHPPHVFSGDTDTARNYLNSIVSSLSTILALCISIILVAIQLTASNYTHRVLDFFVRLPYNASLFTFFLFTIMHSFFLMAKVQEDTALNGAQAPLPNPVRPEMSADLVLVVICFISLLIYMYAVVQLLKPERIILLILRDYHRFAATGKWHAALENVEQICDIAKRAASVSDSVTGTRCLDAMLFVAQRLPLPETEDATMLQMHQTFVDQWSEIVGVAVKEKDIGLLHGVLNALHAQGRQYMLQEAWRPAEMVVKAYRHIAFSHLLPENQWSYMERVSECLYGLAAVAMSMGSRGQTFSLRTWSIIQTIGERVFTEQTSDTSALQTGFLMPRELSALFVGLGTYQSERYGLAIYFELWKSFSTTATIRDAARWAAWWMENIDAPRVFSDGQILAILLARHVNRKEIAQTLVHIWAKAPALYDTSMVQEVVDIAPYIFDGWPWPPYLCEKSSTDSLR